MAERKKIARSTDLGIDETLAVAVDEWKILVVRTASAVYAIENRCPHQNSSLVRGQVDQGLIRCESHGVKIELATGDIAYGAGFTYLEPVRVFSCGESEGWIWVEPPPPEK